MADKKITMVVKVDLECERCNKKIKRVLHKIKDKMNINTISFDEKRNLVTISGPFDAEKVRRKLCCEAGRIIKGMDVKAPEEKKTEEKKDGRTEKEEDGRKTAAAPAVNLRPLLEKMLERPKARTQPPACTCCCGCSCGQQTTQPPAAQVVVAAPSVWPVPASSVSGQGYEAPSSYYGVPVYSIEGWY
ncbi:heavy metal-associated isoprenylated plant protein 6-like isoform X1 [Miscanthus floridulus]|uniref:heavy metal-associated isoprenylated plant protein 6-like isoform X1 n=2 Tax=Miscanthus floridulus TaxID=154761 RepID=UPI00345855EF